MTHQESPRNKQNYNELFTDMGQPSPAERSEAIKLDGKTVMVDTIKALLVLKELGDKRVKQGSPVAQEGTDALSTSGWFDLANGYAARVERAEFGVDENGLFDYDAQAAAGKNSSLRLEISKMQAWGAGPHNNFEPTMLPDPKEKLSISFTHYDSVGFRMDGMNIQGGMGTPFSAEVSPHYDDSMNSIMLVHVNNNVQRAQEAAMAIQAAALTEIAQ